MTDADVAPGPPGDLKSTTRPAGPESTTRPQAGRAPRRLRPTLSPWTTLALVLVTLVAAGAVLWPVRYAATATVDLGTEGSALQEQVRAEVEADQTPALVIQSLGLDDAEQAVQLTAEPVGEARLAVTARHTDPRVAADAADTAAVLAAQDGGAIARLTSPATLTAAPSPRLPWVLGAGLPIVVAAAALNRRRRRAGRA